jgi:AcrR family transcriptional regulator
MSSPPILPVLQPGDDRPERADAARNRGKVLCAAERLFAERGAHCVTMDEIAAAAGVGKGTLFRRFGDRAGLAAAVLSERTRRFQEAIIRGPAPVGPGAPPVERLIAFGEAYIDVHAPQLDLVIAAERAEAGERSAPYVFMRVHVSLLVREAAPGMDADYVTEVLLSALRGDVLAHLERVREMPRERIVAGWAQLVRRLLDSPA